MDIYRVDTMTDLVRGNAYVGRGIVIGKTADGTKAAVAYFIMGRSENSRNRVFVEQGDEVVIHPFDASKVEDPSLIIYSPIKTWENHLIVTNGDQTDTVYDFLRAGNTFEEALETREFEPDAPNFTPRISGMLTFHDMDCSYKMSILKSAEALAIAIRLPTQQQQDWGILFIRMSVTAIRCLRSKGNRNGYPYRMILICLPKKFGKIWMNKIKFPFMCAISTCRRVQWKTE